MRRVPFQYLGDGAEAGVAKVMGEGAEEVEGGLGISVEAVVGFGVGADEPGPDGTHVVAAVAVVLVAAVVAAVVGVVGGRVRRP